MDSLTFATLHTAYADEWMSIAFLPSVKQTFNVENNFYDLSTLELDLKKDSIHHLPIAEAILTIDRQFQSMKCALERALADTTSSEQDRRALIETHISSFTSFIDNEIALLEKAITDIGGKPPHKQQLETCRITMARYNPKSLDGALAAYMGPIALLWKEFNNVLAKYDMAERDFYYQSTISNLAYSVVEWRIIMANSQKIINEDRKVKRVNIYDQLLNTYISSPVKIRNKESQPGAEDSAGSPMAFTPPRAESPLPDESTSDTESTTTQTTTTTSTSAQQQTPQLPTVQTTSPPVTTSTSPLSTSPPQPPISTLSASLNLVSSGQSLIQSAFHLQPNSLPTQSLLQHPTILVGSPTQRGAGQQQIAPDRVVSVGWQKATPKNAGGGQPITGSLSNSDGLQLSTSTTAANICQSPRTAATNLLLETITRGSTNSAVSKQGWMRKRGNNIKTWKRRYFILDTRKHMLFYYHVSPQHANNTSTTAVINNLSTQPTMFELDDIDAASPNIVDGAASNANYNTNNPSMDQLKYKGVIDLHRVALVAPKSSVANDNKNAGLPSSPSKDVPNAVADQGSFNVVIHTPKRVWHLCCESAKSMEEWLVALRSASLID
ncbi:hypothetical protein SAMD00019534_041500 [Acytostelium subglobosum LB1]|uniref:hypothetical protein n=1 Tax=Acytostelium subglobosum LB1 TaxID=1410327 RepID=UPI000644CBC7|nr:hypothetical protein SAMD00019534_041500 [Acytostelium subglobosum LB1]GAM20975.1 hypothetical protein SAMD00019534_041500 [Acytostelium subglobosum LB1]|eukprot:XP_012756109.1 hypothetical protein SAMD00019534_041500 [Acytostelium subglobosum LB1]